jgi:hypothetical protein
MFFKILNNLMSCWIITNERSGSNYLCELLNLSNLFNNKFLEQFGIASHGSLVNKIFYGGKKYKYTDPYPWININIEKK